MHAAYSPTAMKLLIILAGLLFQSISRVNLFQTLCKTCQSPPSDDITLCRCDHQCTLYGDCCPDHSAGSPMINDSLTTTVGYMECRSRYRSLPVLAAGDAYYMVSSCPADWTQDEQFADLISNNCTSTDPDIKDFPPVSDPSTGITYRNVFCAECHNVNMSTILTWSTRLTCKGSYTASNDTTLSHIRKYCSRCSFDHPNDSFVKKTLRWCIPVVSNCPSYTQVKKKIQQSHNYDINMFEYNWFNNLCINGEYNPVQFIIPHLRSLTVHYKNPMCADCNQISSFEFIKCIHPWNPNPRMKDSGNRCSGFSTDYQYSYIGPLPFSALVDMTGEGVVRITSSRITNEVITCGENQVFDPVAGCRDIVCPSGLVVIKGKCVSVTMVTAPPLSKTKNTTKTGIHGKVTNTSSTAGDTINNTSASNKSANQPTYDTSEDPKPGNVSQPTNGTTSNGKNTTHGHGITELIYHYYNCTPISLADDEYIPINNSYVFFRDKVFKVIGNSSDGQPLVCVNFSHTRTNITKNITTTHLSFPAGITELTYIESALSIVACVLILVTYSIFKELRTLPSKLLMNLAVAILLSDIILLVNSMISLHMQRKEFCTAGGIILHFLFLSRFTWMNCLGFEFTRTFVQAFQLKSAASSGNWTPSKQLLLYMIIGWGIPLIIVVITVIVNFTFYGLVRYGIDTDGNQGLCWINNNIALIISTVIPISIAILFNTIMFFFIVSLICVTSRNTTKEIQAKQRAAHIRVVLGVFVVLGITWVFGFVILLFNQPWTWYPFVILNNNQAVLIAICFLATKKIILKYWSLFKCTKSG